MVPNGEGRDRRVLAVALLLLCGALLKALDATCLVEGAVFARIERMRL